MKLFRFVRVGVVSLTCCGLMTAQLAQAAGPQVGSTSTRTAATAQFKIHDVALQDQGTFQGTVVDAQGVARKETPIVVSRQGKIVAQTKTDAKGQFAVSGLTGGVYEVHTSDGTSVYRMWAPRTAPPSATVSALITPNEIARAQGGFGGQGAGADMGGGGLGNGGMLGWLANPWILAGVVAAAIAIPLALDDDDAS